MSDLATSRIATSYKPTVKKTITVKGPLGAFSGLFRVYLPRPVSWDNTKGANPNRPKKDLG
jgi:hypothetical protein